MLIKSVSILSLFFVLANSLTSHAGELKVVTYNTWFLPNVTCSASHTPERLNDLPVELEKLGADIIALQEVWTIAFRNALLDEMKSRGYPYAAYSDSNT